MLAVPVSRYVEVAGAPVHVADFGGEGPPVVCLHGLGGSYVNWGSAAPGLRHHGRVLALDFPGFGLTPPARRDPSIRAGAALLGAYLDSLGEPALVVANSMGGAIALVQAARDPTRIRRLALVSPALPRAPGTPSDPLIIALLALSATPGLAEAALATRRRMISPERAARWTLELCAARPDEIPAEVVEAHIEVARRRRHLPGIDQAFSRAVRTLVAILARRRRFEQRIAQVGVPTLVVHGRQDRLVPVESAQRVASLRPDWPVEILDDVGHVGHIEVPTVFTDIVDGWMADEPAA